MFVLVSDYKEVMESDYTLTKKAIRQTFIGSEEELQIVVEPYGTEAFYTQIKQADGLITAFLPIDEAFLEIAHNLKYISINAIGYSNLDVDAIKKHGIHLCHIKEYCTREVSEHAIAMLMCLNNNLNAYDQDVKNGHWSYANVVARPTLDYMTAVIFGFGKIGKSTGKLLKALGMKVCFVDPFVSQEAGEKEGARKLELEEVYAKADVIINHMALTKENYHMFDYEFFRKCQNAPIFINVGRGGCVAEEGLYQALKDGYVYAAGLDVLEEENPNLKANPLVGMEQVIITPHAAFYSKNSIERLHEISGKNMGYLLSGQEDQVEELI